MIFNLKRSHEVDCVKLFLDNIKAKGGKVGVTSGCWDLFHDMHEDYLVRCARYCDALVVGVDSNALVQAVKGKDRPIIHEARRAAMVDRGYDVKFTFVMNSVKDLERVCEMFTPDYMFKNQTFEGREHIHGVKFCKELIIIPDVETFTSTTEIIDAITKKVVGE